MPTNDQPNRQPKLSSSQYLQQIRQRRLQKTRSDFKATNRPKPKTNQQTPPQVQTLTPEQEEILRAYEENLLPENFDLPKSRVAPGYRKPVPERTIIEWTAPSRPFKKRNKKFFMNIIVIALLISLIFFFAGQVLPVAVILSAAFLVYVLSVTPPQKVKFKITTFGINLEGNLYYWEELGRFWFTKKYGSRVLNVETGRFPGRITLMLDGTSEETVDSILSEVLLKQKPKDTFYEKSAKWLNKKIPLDID